MSFKVKVLLDSISPPTNDHPDGVRLVTFKTRFPREILAEVNTHTILSKSASSSRAIPGKRLRDFIEENLYYPEFGANKPGMQAGDLVGNQGDIRELWERASLTACGFAEELDRLGVHKQVVNRLVENFGWTNQVITGTDWANFFALRTHPDAHPAFRTLARAMYIAFARSTPKPLNYGEWHLPFVGQGKLYELNFQVLERPGYTNGQMPGDTPCLTRSVACCARVSYQTADGRESTQTDDERTCGKLLKEPPYHVSPFQHQATPWHPAQEATNPKQRSNLRGWLQYRKTIPNECIHVFAPTAAEVAAWGIDEAVFSD